MLNPHPSYMCVLLYLYHRSPEGTDADDSSKWLDLGSTGYDTQYVDAITHAFVQHAWSRALCSSGRWWDWRVGGWQNKQFFLEKKSCRTLPETNGSPMKITIFPSKNHQNGGFSMAMLVYRSVVFFWVKGGRSLGQSDSRLCELLMIHRMFHPKTRGRKLEQASRCQSCQQRMGWSWLT